MKRRSGRRAKEEELPHATGADNGAGGGGNRKDKDRPSARQWRRIHYVVIGVIASLPLVHYLHSKVPRFPQCFPAIGSSESKERIIITASHLRQSPDRALRLRIIEHNLRLLFSGDEDERPLRSIVVFSVDGSKDVVGNMVINEWRSGPAKGLVHDVIFVDNDAIAVDVPKWMAAINNIKKEIWKTNARVMLTNDSFLLVRNVPELWDDGCGGVCGLVWSTPRSDPARHIQSYMRSLSACAVDNYMSFCEENESSAHNVNELIQKFEVNLGWARGDVSAIYDDVGEHPDAEGAQQKLLPRGYPAIKLKKFFVTDDPWIEEDENTRTRLSPAFSPDVYRRMNHDLNHFSNEQLEDHFASSGIEETRIYSTLSLKMKDWMREELEKMGDDGKSTVGLLEDYLDALNVANAKAVAKDR
mmetsp:Transcript_20446/g.43854  ORF Transcript_20446/g.43854 Transcript_20446/m.43854 type:complete len:415 (-) Transcript_20446:145-1389(-)